VPQVVATCDYEDAICGSAMTAPCGSPVAGRVLPFCAKTFYYNNVWNILEKDDGPSPNHRDAMSIYEEGDGLLAVVRDGLLAIGYEEDLLREQYAFADLTTPESNLQRIDLAAFAEEPVSYRSACFGITVLHNGQQGLRSFLSLGAPQLLTIHPREKQIGRWIVKASDEPELIEKLSGGRFRERLNEHGGDWSPRGVLRAKAIRDPGLQQLDFYDVGLVPMLEQIVQGKLDVLLRSVLAECQVLFRDRHSVEPDYAQLYRLVFRLIAAKLLGDRNYPGSWIEADAEAVLSAVERHYFGRSREAPALKDPFVRQAAWERIRRSLPLQNLSVETLAYVYENTLVAPDVRATQDIHATPREIAEFVVNHLPFEELPAEQRTVFEPFAGHAPFLIASLARLRGLLPAGWTATRRHDYLVDVLSGLENEPFAREVARYSLMLADYPNPNGWKLIDEDAFTGPALERELARANIVLCNPPFGDFSEQERAIRGIDRPNKAAEALRRVLEHPPAMLGFVLPRSFTQGALYEPLRRRLAEVYPQTFLLVLPDVAFQHSEAETVLVIAYRERKANNIRRSALVSKEDYPKFVSTGRTTWDDHGHRLKGLPSTELWIPPLLAKLVEALQGFQILDDVADVHRGIEYKGNIKQFVSDKPHPALFPGLKDVRSGLEPYVTGRPVYFRIEEELMLYSAHRLNWQRPKVLANAARISRGAWTIAAALDESGLVCSQRFHGIWPSSDFPIEVIAAVLNGPLANAYIGLQVASHDNQVRLVKLVPLPQLNNGDLARIRSLVREYMAVRLAWRDEFPSRNEEGACLELMLAIDAAVLAGYGLAPRLERELLDRFAGERRPGPITMDRYYPEDFRAAVPLRVYISDAYREASVEATLNRVLPIHEPGLTDLIEELAEES
jgi:hypothetical protein